MYQTLLRDGRFFDLLFRCDEDLAREARRGKCPRCGGPLHQANYVRKPRGGEILIGSPQALRLSFCCGQEGCRRRLTPPSLRFLGRRVYLGAAMILVSAMHAGARSKTARELQQAVGVSPRTLRRWRRWWQAFFPHTPFWQATRGRLRSPIRARDLPRALLGLFAGDLQVRLLTLLRWLAPLTGGSGRSKLCEGLSLPSPGTQKTPAARASHSPIASIP